jgi:hypothetical protein
MKIAAIFLQTVAALTGIAVLSLMLWEPNIEGRNAHATFFQVYFTDPFLAYAYVASLSFFTALWQGFRLLGYARQGRFFSAAALTALRTAKLCAMAMLAFVVMGEILLMLGPSDDRAGGVFMGLLIGFGATLIGSAATLFEGLVRDAMAMRPAD